MSDVGRTRVAAYAVCFDAAGRILLCRIAPSVIPGEVWTLPGGGLEFGEPPEAAVLRELSEETGQSGEILSLLEVNDRLVGRGEGAGALHAIRIVYRVRVSGGELRDEAEGTTDACAWFTPEEAARLHLGELARRALDLVARGRR
ncbi:MAG: NUDIX domain-containing protein [Candidatus Limnocylindrales bacterium]|nr:NUDIX domain-containing protein [Candidatus Limnocylindrales bacterium]